VRTHVSKDAGPLARPVEPFEPRQKLGGIEDQGPAPRDRVRAKTQEVAVEADLVGDRDWIAARLDSEIELREQASSGATADEEVTVGVGVKWPESRAYGAASSEATQIRWPDPRVRNVERQVEKCHVRQEEG
jgi:hypothetical protein